MNRLKIEREILRRIFRPTKARDGTYIIKTNDELNNLIKNKNKINCTEAQRLSWFGHVHQMTYDRIVRLYELKPLPTRLAGRPTIRWEMT